MSLLTHDAYAAIAGNLTPPKQSFIDGAFRHVLRGQTCEATRPDTGKTGAKVTACNEDDVNHAVKNARGAFGNGCKSRLHPRERKETLIHLAKPIERNTRKRVVLDSIDSGKTIDDCERVENPRAMNCLIWQADPLDNIHDQVSTTSDTTDYGIAACIVTASIKRTIRGARAIHAGTVAIYSFGEGDITNPVGGFNHSGCGGRGNGIHARDQYTRLKNIRVDLADDADEAV